MMTYRSCSLMTCLTAAVAALASGRADAALTATLQLVPEQSSVAVNTPLGIDVYLRNIHDTNIASPAKVIDIDLDFGGTITSTSTPLKFATASPAPTTGFTPSALLSTLFPTSNDSTLADGYSPITGDLEFVYSAGNKTTTGYLANGADFFIGTLYVTASAVNPSYSISAAYANTLVQSDDANFDPFTLTTPTAQFAVTATPEPATLLLSATGVITLGRRRRD